MKSNTFLCLICCILMIYVLTAPDRCITAAGESLHLWSTSVFPSLFPFFVLSSILKQTGIIENIIYKSLKNKDYNLYFITAIGLVCGYPSSSKLIGQSKTNEPIHIYALSTSPSPVFITGTVATIYLQNTSLALYLLAATYLSLFTSYILVKQFTKSKPLASSARPLKNHEPVGHLITTAITDGMKSQGIILGIITVVSILASFLDSINAFSLLSAILTPIALIFRIPPSAITPFLKGLLEMTTGVSSVCSLNVSVYHKLTICGFITSFGGLSIFMESLAFINNKIKATSIAAIKLLHGCLTYLYIRLLLLFIPVSQSVILPLPDYKTAPILLLTISSVISILIIAVLHQISRRGT